MDAARAAEARPIDANAVAAIVRRLAKRGEAPWLHGEVARRMAERLALIKRQPVRVLDWWSMLGASAAVLAQTYPRAQRVAVEPPSVLAAAPATSAPWWRRVGRGVRMSALDERGDVPGEADLVWANMMLPAVADPPALFARWHGLLAVVVLTR